MFLGNSNFQKTHSRIPATSSNRRLLHPSLVWLEENTLKKEKSCFLLFFISLATTEKYIRFLASHYVQVCLTHSTRLLQYTLLAFRAVVDSHSLEASRHMTDIWSFSQRLRLPRCLPSSFSILHRPISNQSFTNIMRTSPELNSIFAFSSFVFLGIKFDLACLKGRMRILR